MRNLKRALSMALASVMVLGLMVVGASAAGYEDFTDKSEIVNTEAVSTMVSLGVISGKEDGSYYDPTGSLTRAEACTLIARMLGGGKDPVLGSNIKSTFTDTQGHWAESYIAYCANLGIIVGVGDGSFNPDGTLTGTAAAKMVLCALGYKPEFEGIGGANWELATNTLATKVKLYDGIDTINPSETITRDDVAQLIYNGVQAQEVEYRNLQGDYSGTLYAQEIGTMLSNRFGVVKVEGVVAANEVFGINGKSATQAGKTQLVNCNSYTSNGTTHTYDGIYPVSMNNDLVGQRVVIYVKFNNALSPNAASSTVLGDPIVSDKTTVVETSARLKNTDAVKDALKGSGISMPSAGTATSNLYTEGKSVTGTSNGVQTVPGVRQRFIDNTGDGTVDLIMQEKAALSKVSVYNEKDEKLTLSSIGSIDFDDIIGYGDVAKDDYVLVTKYDDTYVVTKAETVEGEVTAYNAGTPASITIDGTKYAKGAGADKTTDLDGSKLSDLSKMVGDTYRLYLDASGNILSALVIDEALGNYAVITGSTGDPTPGFSSGKVKLTMADGTTGTYTVDLLASAKKWSSSVNTGSDSAKEEAMARALDNSGSGIAGTLVTYTLNDNGTVVLGQPSYINSADYADASGAVDNGNSANKTVLYSSDSSYEVGGTKVVVDNSTVFFIKDTNGYNVVVGLNKLPSKGVTPTGNVKAIYDRSGSTNVVTAMYLEVADAYASSSSYFYITGDYSMSTEDGTNVYTYPVVFEDGTTGTIKTKDTTTYAKNAVYSYSTDSKGYATSINPADGYTVNTAFVYEVGNNTVSLWNANDYSVDLGSYPLASNAKVWNVEDTDNVYDTTLTKAAVVAIVLNDDKEIETAFVSEIRDSADASSMAPKATVAFSANTITVTPKNGETVTVKWSNGGESVNKTFTYQANDSDDPTPKAQTVTATGIANGQKVTVTVEVKDMVTRVYEVTVSGI